jgi:hypothetical protein
MKKTESSTGSAADAGSGAPNGEIIVKLDDLSTKQRLKEYKLAAKEIKSKDSAKKKLAIEKFHDERYFLEGDCLIPLIDSLTPKKVCFHFAYFFPSPSLTPSSRKL